MKELLIFWTTSEIIEIKRKLNLQFYLLFDIFTSLRYNLKNLSWVFYRSHIF